MKTRTLDLAYEWELNIVEVTQGKNGYPEGLYKAICDFDTYNDAYNFAEEVNGEVVLLSKRDGHLLWTNNGKQYESLKREDYIGDEYDAYNSYQYDSFESWAKGEIENMLGEGCDLIDIKRASEALQEAYEAIVEMSDYNILIINRGNYGFDIAHQDVTEIHDDDVTTYMIAVVDYETDEDETNEEDEE